jgi:hypothetical protein
MLKPRNTPAKAKRQEVAALIREPNFQVGYTYKLVNGILVKVGGAPDGVPKQPRPGR